MAVLFRIFLVGLLIYLVFRTIASFGARTGIGDEPGSRISEPGKEKGDRRQRGIPKDVGEYIDYEEVD